MRLATVLITSLLSVVAIAEDRFYTTVDAQGHVQVIKSESSSDTVTPSAPLKKSTIDPLLTMPPPAKSSDASQGVGTRQVDSETYIDTELLERKNFNVDDKKRFYYLSGDGLARQVVESKDGIATPPVIVSESKKLQAYVSSNYVSVSKEEIQLWYPQQKECINQAYVKKNSKLFKDVNNIWVKPAFNPNVVEMDGFLQLPTAVPMVTQLRVASFATTHKKPTFYLPVVVFLDGRGCALSGVWQYWSRAHVATEIQYASVDGLINIPAQSTYIVFYRPPQTLKADVPLSLESGSFVVEAY